MLFQAEVVLWFSDINALVFCKRRLSAPRAKYLVRAQSIFHVTSVLTEFF
jgi:hypothetical protein